MGSGNYKNVIAIPVNANKMCDKLTVKIYEGDTLTDEFSTSIGYICGYYINADSKLTEPYANLSKSLLKYIDAANECFNK